MTLLDMLETKNLIFEYRRKSLIFNDITLSLQDGQREHNSNHKGFSGGVGDWAILYIETYSTKTAAYQREGEIKAWKSRKIIEQLIAGQKEI